MATMAKKMLYSIIFGIIFIQIFNYLFHGLALADLYEQTADVWRDKAARAALSSYAIVGNVLFVCFTAILFSLGYTGKGTEEGIRFGLLLGWIGAAGTIGMHTYLPIPLELTLLWTVGTVLQGVGLGYVFAMCYCDCPKAKAEAEAKAKAAAAASKKPAAKKKAPAKRKAPAKKKTTTKKKK